MGTTLQARAGLCLKGRGAIGTVPERLQSGHKGCQSGWGVGGFWRLEMRLVLVLGYGNAFGVDQGSGEGGGGYPPPLQAIPWARVWQPRECFLPVRRC